jgi:hypothetical protein
MSVPRPCCRQPRRMWRALAACGVWVWVLCATVAAAGEAPAVDALIHHPSAHLHDGWLVRGATPMDQGQWSLAAALHYARLPLRFSAGPLQQAVIGDAGLLELGAAAGLPNGWNATVQLPIAWMLRGGGPNLAQLDALPVAPALGDVRLGVRRPLWRGPLAAGQATVAAALDLELPTATAASWMGGAGAAVIDVLASGQVQGWRGDASLGVRLSPTQTLSVRSVDAFGAAVGDPRAALRLGSSLRVAAGAGRGLMDGRLGVRGELALQVPLVDTVASSMTVLDLLASADWALRPWLRGGLALAGSPSSGVGAAAVRALAMLRFDPAMLPSDLDADGLDDRVDRCPQQAEDRDGFEDRDGCPDPDDDADGVADAADQCRLVAEDRDGFEDADGCPDADNDRDGIDDSRDRCALVAEDRDGFDDDDGCPDADDDGDGIADADDLCPRSAENRNGFEDGDGCPDMALGEGVELSRPATPEQLPAASGDAAVPAASVSPPAAAPTAPAQPSAPAPAAPPPAAKPRRARP